MGLPAAATPRRIAVAATAVAVSLSCATLATGAGALPARPHAARARTRAVARPSDQVSSGIGPCPDTGLMPTASNTGRIVRSTLCLINAQRRRFGLAPLVEDARLDHSAQAHSSDMVAHGYFQHVSPSGSTPVSRMTSAGYLTDSGGYEVGENIAWGTLNLATPASIVTAWMNSPDHRANILRGTFRQTGVGVSAGVPGSLGQGEPGGTYTQDFGVLTGG